MAGWDWGSEGSERNSRAENGTLGSLLQGPLPEWRPIASKRIFSQDSENARKGNERLLSPGPGDQPANCSKPSASRIFPLGFQTDRQYFHAQRKARTQTIGNMQFPSRPQGDAVIPATSALGTWEKTNSVEGLEWTINPRGPLENEEVLVTTY